MRTEGGQISLPEITEDVQVSGILLAHANVRGGATLYLSGVANKGLTVEDGGRAEIRGVVLGDVTNRGGRVELHGVVNGIIHNSGGGQVTVHRGAYVDGQRAESTYDL